MSVLAYCADHENSGVIDDAKTWDTEDCLILLAIGKDDIDEAVAAGLCEWRGEALICHLYDHDGHAALMTKRAQGHHGAKGGKPSHKHTNPEGIISYTLRVHDRVYPPSYPQKSPDQSIPDQKSARARDDSALALPSGASQRPSASEKDLKQRAFISALGGELDLHGKDLLPEWRKRFRGFSPDRIALIFNDAKPAIRLPSNFRDAAREHRGTV